jgi:uncharacterized protein (DUF1800 family)
MASTFRSAEGWRLLLPSGSLRLQSGGMADLNEAAAVRRLVDRLGFGAGGDGLAVLQQRGLDATVESLLHPSGEDIGVTATPAPRLALLPRPTKGADGKLDRAALKTWRKQLREQQTELAVWWLDRMVAAGQPTRERLTWFWHGHFATSVQKVKSAALMLQQNEAMRTLGLGGFGPLAHAMIVDPAMLVWLDGNDNTAKAPNENLGREFMELFGLGHGNYSESDVREAARALTGWKLDKRTGTAVLRPKLHDTGSKTLLGTTGDLGAEEFVSVVVDQPASAEFIVSRLWFRLVSTETPPTEAVKAELLSTYGAQRDVTAVLAAMVASPPFRAGTTSLVKQPVEWFVGLCRVLNVRPSRLDEAERKRALATLRGMGQLPFRPPSVGGWPAGAGWLTTASALARMNAARLLAAAADLDELRTSARTRTEAVRRLLGVDHFSTRTANAVAQVADRPAAAVAVAAASPEYSVSA